MFYSDSEDLDEESEDEEQFFYTSLPDLTYQPSEASCLFRGLVKSQSLPNLYQYDGSSSTSEQDEEVRLQCNQLFFDKPGTF